MERFVKGDVVVIDFPFSDFSGQKRRPALVLAAPEGSDLLVCQITSVGKDRYSVDLSDADFSQGKLSVPSFARPNKVFTADKIIIDYKVGTLRAQKMQEILLRVRKILEQ